MDNKSLLNLLANLHNLSNGRQPQTEGELRAAVAARLREHEWEVTEQVACTAGTADLVARRVDRMAIIETKLVLTRRLVFEAAGQVLAYKMAIDPIADAVVIGYARHLPQTTVAAVAALGVTVITWDREEGDRQQDIRTPSTLGHPQPPLLRWNVQALAQLRGVTTVSQLAKAINLNKQTLYGIWRGETVQVSVQVLGRLCVGLDGDPGDWFEWEGIGEGRRLVWNVASVAERVGLTPTKLAFRSGIYFRMSRLYVLGTAQSTSVSTLSKLASALATEAYPFDVGDLFTWDNTAPVKAPDVTIF